MALLCDPPYSLAFMGKKWDDDIAFKPETWAALSEHLYPGAFGMAFASARGWHRLAVAIEDAGLVIHPTIYAWVTGSGFPKSTRIERDFANGNSPFCQCESSQPQSQRRVAQDNVSDEMSIVSSSQADCLQGCHSDDGQPHRGAMGGPDVEPSQGGVPERTHFAGPSWTGQEDSEPSHNPSLVQCNDHHASKDCPRQTVSASESSPLSKGATYPADDSIHASRGGNGDSAPVPTDSDGDTMACHNLHTDSSVFGSSVPPFPENCIHDTTDGPYCQTCGKVKRGIWDGHRYGLQAMKPAAEYIIVFQKPYAGKPVDSITATGAGALWIDGGRVPTDGDNLSGGSVTSECKGPMSGDGREGAALGMFAPGAKRKEEWTPPQGRWPANFCLVHTPECKRVGTVRVKNRSGSVSGNEPSHTGDENTACYGEYGRIGFDRYADPDGLETIAAWDCAETCPVKALGEMSGESKSTGGRIYQKGGIGQNGIYNHYNDIHQKGDPGFGDTGTAARFFFQADWSHEIAERLAEAEPVHYCAKASRKERDAGLEEYPLRAKYKRDGSGNSHEVFAHGGDEAWQAKNPCHPMRNHWPTVKPIALTKWLATLLLPPAEYAPRRILIPFCGSGSEGIGAGLVGWDEMVLIDSDEEACELAEARLAHWLAQPVQLELIP